MTDKAMKDLEDDEIVLRVEKDPLIGKKLAGRYDIVSVLGRGGMGVVYKAHQSDIDRFVAIKTLHISKVVDSHVIQRFRSEAQAVSRVRHPNTVMLYDFGVSDEGVPFLVMDILDGLSFRQIIKEQGSLPLERASHIFQQVCAALSAAHKSGIVHKDLKPENIMICNSPGRRDWVYVLDFGIAGMMESGQSVSEIIGSPPYMSPEQCSMQAIVDHRSDIYSLGVCLFESLCAKFPFQARTAMEMLDCHISAKPRLLKEMGTKYSTYESVTQVILKAMEKRPEKRHQSVDEFIADFNEAVQKDSKRGMQLRDRVSMEVDAPKVDDFVELKQILNEEEIEIQIKSSARIPKYTAARSPGFIDNLKAFVHGDNYHEQDAGTSGDQKYHFSNCPHCDAPTEQGINLCLACGRSLAAKSDFSKIRAARGEFSLPKYQELGGATAASSSSREVSQRTRNAMLKSGRAWTRSTGLIVLSFLLVLCVFVLAGGPKLLFGN
ncbi:MAG: serine/threonine protein kinase [Candidatus Obscuribacterales bacterium]|nr:serine/threonine protein kinase [Candidatus Obscuribacterales bacterium]